jgi:hypothetical protein
MTRKHRAAEAPRVAVAILGRAPIPGEAKTRLIPRLGAPGAAALQAWLLQRAVAAALVADVGPVSLWCAGDPAHPAFALCRAFGAVSLRQQGAGDLGARMLQALQESAAPGGTLLVGTDCPALTPRPAAPGRQCADRPRRRGDPGRGRRLRAARRPPACTRTLCRCAMGQRAGSWRKPANGCARWAGAGASRQRCGMSIAPTTSTACWRPGPRPARRWHEAPPAPAPDAAAAGRVARVPGHGANSGAGADFSPTSWP